MKPTILVILRTASMGFILFGAGALVPLAGQIVAVFTPVPFIVTALRHGVREALAAFAIVAVIITALAGPQAGVILLLGFGLMAAGISLGMRKGLPPEKVVLLGGLLPVLAASVPLLMTVMHTEGGILAPAETYMRKSLQEAVEIYRNAGLTEMAQAVSDASDRFVHYFVRLLPGFAVALSLLQAAACYGISRSRLQRDPGQAALLTPPPAFAAWHAPDAWVWGLIASLACIAAPQEIVRFTGLNFGIVFLCVYTAQGMAIVDFTLRKAGVHAPTRSIIHVLFLILPSNMLLPPLGVVDIWADVRKVRKTEEKTEAGS